MSDSFTFDGIDLGGDDYKVMLEASDFVHMPALDGSHVQVPTVGSYVQGNSFKPSAHTLNVSIEGSSHSDLLAKIANFGSAINGLKGNKKLVIDTMSDRFSWGRFMGELKAPLINERSIRYTLSFPFEFVFESTLQDETFSIESDPDDITVPASGSVAGSLNAWPVFYVRNQTGGNITGQVKIENTTAATPALVWDPGTTVLADGHWLVFSTGDEPGLLDTPTDSNMKNIQRFDMRKIEADVTNPISQANIPQIAFRSSGFWPHLAPGVANTIRVTGVSTGTLRVRWYGRFA